MTIIRIDINQVLNMNQIKQRDTDKLKIVQSDLSRLNYQVDHKISARNNIASNLNRASIRLDELNNRIHRLHTFIDQSMEMYWRNEEKLTREAEQVINNTQSGSQRAFWDIVKNLIPSTLPIVNKLLNSKMFRLMDMSMNLRFRMIKKDGMQYIKVQRPPNKYQAGDLRDILAKYMGGNKWSWSYVNKLINDGIPVYNIEKNSLINKYTGRLSHTSFDEFNQFIKDIPKKASVKVWESTKSGFVEGINLWKDFDWRNSSDLTKFGKSFGIAGTVLGVVGNVEDAFFNPNTEDATTGEKVKTFLVNTSVDVGIGGASVAVGATVGSFFVPPVGTVVGAGVGLTVNTIVNVNMIGDPKTSIAKYTKQKANEAVDAVVDFSKDTVDTVKGKVNELGNAVSEKTKNIANNIGNKLSVIF